MNKQEFAQFTMELKTYYSKENILPNNQAMDLWYKQLNDIPYDVASLFLNKWVACEKWSPTIADIRAGVADITQGEVADWGKGWEQIEKAIRYYGIYRVDEAYASMDEITREVAERLGFKNICMSENIQNDRANFRMLYEQVAQKKKTNRQINPNVALLMNRTVAAIEQNAKPAEEINTKERFLKDMGLM